MALELIIVEGLFAFVLGLIVFAYFSGLKIFYVASFILLMLSSFLIWSSGGIIISHYYSIVDDVPIYSENIITPDAGALFLIVQLSFWSGLALTVWSVFFTSMVQTNSSSRKVFVWD